MNSRMQIRTYLCQVRSIKPIIKLKLTMQFTALLMAVVAGLCSCQRECSFPTNDDLELVIARNIIVGDSPSPPTIIVIRFHPVCLAFGEQQDRYRVVSVVVEYTCSGNANCPSGTAVEQIESECINEVWSNSVLGSTDNVRSVFTEANFTTTTREDCSHCLSPELIEVNRFPITTDSVTHCSGKCIITYTAVIYL